MRTQFSHLSDTELVQCHRWDIQGDELVEELWLRLEAAIAGTARKPVLCKEDV